MSWRGFHYCRYSHTHTHNASSAVLLMVIQCMMMYPPLHVIIWSTVATLPIPSHPPSLSSPPPTVPFPFPSGSWPFSSPPPNYPVPISPYITVCMMESADRLCVCAMELYVTVHLGSVFLSLFLFAMFLCPVLAGSLVYPVLTPKGTTIRELGSMSICRRPNFIVRMSWC